MAMEKPFVILHFALAFLAFFAVNAPFITLDALMVIVRNFELLKTFFYNILLIILTKSVRLSCKRRFFCLLCDKKSPLRLVKTSGAIKQSCLLMMSFFYLRCSIIFSSIAFSVSISCCCACICCCCASISTCCS